MKDLIGLVSGKLTVIKYHGLKNNRPTWLCKCLCGNEVLVTTSHLTSKNPEHNTRSCGCLRIETRTGKFLKTVCKRGHDLKPENLYFDTRGKRSCLECRKMHQKQRPARRPDYLKKYGLTLEKYDQLLEEQGGGCAICHEPPTGRRLHVDHDHNCCDKGCENCVRGLLCQMCNQALGMLRDDVKLLSAAIQYLNKRK